MYRAKSSRQPYCFYELSMDAEAQARAELERDLKKAISNGEIVPFYQPIMSLDREQMLGFEILARWQHPTKGLIAPDAFIPVAEDTGLIGEITYVLLRSACAEALSWPEHLILSVNVAPTQLKDPSVAARLLSILGQIGFPPHRLEVEVTETALVSDLETAKLVLAELQRAGVIIALDDFGTGYSSLYHLRELHFDKIKIDRSFVMSLRSNGESAKIIQAIVSLGKSLGMPAVAEGIESRETLAEVIELGCHLGQGYLFSAPVPVTHARAMISWNLDTRKIA